jgi:hypothetical protein
MKFRARTRAKDNALNLHIGNRPWSTTKRELYQLFAVTDGAISLLIAA